MNWNWNSRCGWRVHGVVLPRCIHAYTHTHSHAGSCLTQAARLCFLLGWLLVHGIVILCASWMMVNSFIHSDPKSQSVSLHTGQASGYRPTRPIRGQALLALVFAQPVTRARAHTHTHTHVSADRQGAGPLRVHAHHRLSLGKAAASTLQTHAPQERNAHLPRHILLMRPRAVVQQLPPSPLSAPDALPQQRPLAGANRRGPPPPLLVSALALCQSV